MTLVSAVSWDGGRTDLPELSVHQGSKTGGRQTLGSAEVPDHQVVAGAQGQGASYIRGIKREPLI